MKQWGISSTLGGIFLFGYAMAHSPGINGEGQPGTIESWWIPFSIGLVLCIAGPMLIGFQYILDTRAERDRQLVALKAEYDLALHELENSPHEKSLRVSALEKGRSYYALLMPDTQTVNRYGVPISEQNNSSGRELRIQADIEARLGPQKTALK